MSVTEWLVVIGLLGSYVAAAWVLYSNLAVKIEKTSDELSQKMQGMEQSSQIKIDRTFTRMDENKIEYYKNFLLKEVHEETRKYQLEINDQKFLSLIKLFETNLNYVTQELKALRDQINNNKKIENNH